MAQFATQGSLKLLFNGEGVTSILEHRDPLHYNNNFRSIHSCRRRIGCIGSSGRGHFSSFYSSMSGKWSRCNAEPRPSDCVYEEDDSDEGIPSSKTPSFFSKCSSTFPVSRFVGDRKTGKG